jgi:predicted DNA-binding transcriptional regulator YafY
MEIIRSAIEDGCALSFCYPRNPDHHDAPIHTVTPSALAWVDGTYYLLGRRAPHDPLSHFRVDRMTGVQAVAPSGRPRGQVPDAAPLSEAEAYVRTRCSMISGREERVRIRFHASLREAVFERFGRDVELDEQDGNIVVTCSMIPGSGLMGWLFMLGEEAEILQPISLRKDMMRRLAVHNRMYGL